MVGIVENVAMAHGLRITRMVRAMKLQWWLVMLVIVLGVCDVSRGDGFIASSAYACEGGGE